MEAKNGQMPAGFVPPTPNAPNAVQGKRICLARHVTVSNPGVSYQSAEPACGQPLREGVGDQLTFEHELVSCPLCKQLLEDAKRLQGQQQTTEESTRAVQHAPTGPAVEPEGASSRPPVRRPSEAKGALDELLDLDMLEAWKAELEGELEAVKVFLDAARARAEKLTVKG